MIKISKTGDDSEFCNTVLLEQIHLFNDDIYDVATKLREDTGNLNIIVDEDNEEDKENNNNNSDDEKPTNTKELIQETMNKHNDTKTIKKEIKKDDNNTINKYDSKNHVIPKSTRRDTDKDRYNERKDELNRETRREQNKRVFFF